MIRTWRTPGSFFDLIDVCAFHLSAIREPSQSLHTHSAVLHQCRKAACGDNRMGVNARLRVADDAVILGVLSLTLLSAGAGSAAALEASSP